MPCGGGHAPLALPFRLGKNVAQPAEKVSYFWFKMSQLFSLFVFRNRCELSEKNKKKTRFVKHAYPVLGGAVNKSCFLLIFFRKFRAISKKK